MSDADPILDDDDEPKLDPNDPGEVATAFPTKGAGWSGRDAGDDADSDD
jgi:hypothetical protein